MSGLRPTGRRASTKGVKKFDGDELVEGVVHKASGRTFASQAELEAFEADTEAVEAAVAENQARLAAVALAEQQTAQEEEERRIQEEKAAAKAAKKAAKEAAKAAEAEQAALAQVDEDERKMKEEKAAAKAARKAAKAAEAEQAALAQAAEDERRAQEEEEAQQALQIRIVEEKARREKLRQEEAAASAAEAAAERAEAERLAEERAEAARAALAVANEEDSAELREKKRRAEERRRKQAAFLADTDSFGAAFEVHNAKAQQQKIEQIGKTKDILAGNLANQAEGFEGVAAKYTPQEYTPSVPREREPIQPKKAPSEKEEDEKDTDGVVQFTGGNSDTFNSSSSALFSYNGNNNNVDIAASSNPLIDDGPLRRPSALGGGNKKSKAVSRAAPLVESNIGLKPNVPVGRVGQEQRNVADVPSYKQYETAKDLKNEFTEEEGTGADESLSNVLTVEERGALTAEEKIAWRAKQEDLGRRRRGFHGAVTYAFDGIFSWQMYGSAEAVDESGNSYTEYLMRCQWGTSWENLQPWISARRYREFDTLDYDLRRSFPNYERSMPTLPAKDFFRALQADVVDKRRQTLESYMSRVVLHLPTILRSRIISDFLGIEERIRVIKKQIAEGIRKPIAWQKRNESEFYEKASRRLSGHEGAASPHKDDVEARKATEDAAIRASISEGTISEADLLQSKVETGTQAAPVAPTLTPEHISSEKSDITSNAESNVDESKFIRTVEQAEAKRTESIHCPALNEDQLSFFEEELRKLIIGLQAHSGNKKIKKSSEGYRKLIKITTAWPKLRATCQVEGRESSTSPTLIPRAMQAEEDLVKLIKDFEDAMATANHLAVLGI
jgi:hypothetical protein